VMYGFASGGSEFNNKHEGKDNLFGGGAGAGVTITPIAFIAITKDDVKLLNVTNFKDSQDRAVGLVPELFDKIVALFKKDKSDKNDEEKAEETEAAETGIDDPKV
ncbi:MAG: GerW family sporulation protein, partial [Clostridia bacterium]|nr:GerW family sporulation protein [Clostridia bacterium]